MVFLSTTSGIKLLGYQRLRIREELAVVVRLLHRKFGEEVFVDATEHNRSIVNAYGLVAILIFAALVVIYFVRGRVGILMILLALIVGFFDPFWHYGGGGGDCGQSFAELAKYVTIILGGILLLQVALWRFRRRARMIPTRT